MKYRGVFLDAGETLLAPHPSFGEVVALVLREKGFEVSSADADRAFESVAPMFVGFGEKIGSRTWSTSRDVSRRFWGLVYAAELERMGIDDPDAMLANLLYERFTRYESYRLFPDALPALDSLKQAGVVVGLISNFEEWLEGMLTEWEVSAYFDLMVISGKEGIEKPDPEIFLRALDRAGLTAAESVYVGDHPAIDVEAAEQVGMAGILIDRRGRSPDFEGTKITTLEELPPLLELDQRRR
jgi:putative hydrolase of the HAD superfamily